MTDPQDALDATLPAAARAEINLLIRAARDRQTTLAQAIAQVGRAGGANRQPAGPREMLIFAIVYAAEGLRLMNDPRDRGAAGADGA